MIKVLRKIKGHNKVESLQIMLEVIEILEKNCDMDYSLNIKEYMEVSKVLENYYCEIKELFIKERGFLHETN